MKIAPLPALLLWAMLAYVLSLVNLEWGHFLPLFPFGSFGRNTLCIVYLGGLLLALMQTARQAALMVLGAAADPAPVRARSRFVFLLLFGLILSLPTLATVLGGVLKLTHPLVTFLPALVNDLPSPAQMVVTIFFATAGLSLVGACVGRVFRHPNTLLAGAGFACFFDIVVVTMGTVAQVMKQNSGSLIAAASIGAGASGSGGSLPFGMRPHGPAPIPPLCSVTIGPADVLFVALFLGAVIELRLGKRATFAWMFALLWAALALVQTTGLPIPALAPMGVAVLIANVRYAAFSRDEKFALGYGGAFAVLCAGFIIWGAQKYIKPDPPKFGFVYGSVRRDGGGPPVVQAVLKGSPADKAGLHPGDILLTVNGTPTQSLTVEQFGEERAKSLQTGTFVLTVQRKGEPKPRAIIMTPPK